MVERLENKDSFSAKKGGHFAYAWIQFRQNWKIESVASFGVIAYLIIAVILNPPSLNFMENFLAVMIAAVVCVLFVLVVFFAFNLNIGDRMVEITLEDGAGAGNGPRIFLRIWKNDENALVTFLVTKNVPDDGMNPYKNVLTCTRDAAIELTSMSPYSIRFSGLIRSGQGTVIRAKTEDSKFSRKEIFRPTIFMFSGVMSIILLVSAAIGIAYVNLWSTEYENSGAVMVNMMFGAMLVMGLLSRFCNRREERAWFLLGQHPETRSCYFDATKEMRDYLVSLVVGLLSITLIVFFVFGPSKSGDISAGSIDVISKVISAIILLLTISSIGKILGAAKHSFEKVMWDNRESVS